MSIVPETEVKRGPSLIIQIAVLLALTVMAAGFGWLSGGFLNGETKTAAPPPAVEGGAEHGAAAVIKANIVDLAPITTNLSVPETVWIRLELSLMFDQPPQDSMLADAIQQDILAYVRTVKLMQVQGASGYQHLKSDLAERAAIRSKGLVKDVLVRTMLFE
ncbi:flagellar basal body-associated FliL family protein [Rhizobiaceae sp. 2RAB30]